MKIICLDTETTDLVPGSICQLAYIVEENNTIVKRVNQYFKVDRIDDEAAKVNGLSVELLDGLSGGTIFADRATEFYNDLNGALVVAHSVDFDEKFISAELYKAGISFFFTHKLCTKEYMTEIVKLPGTRGRKYKWPSLEECLKYMEITPEQVVALSKYLYGDHEFYAHDARYDTSALYLLVYKLRQYNMINLESIPVTQI